MFKIEINNNCSIHVNLEPHNVRFHSVQNHHMFLRVIHAPIKSVLAHLSKADRGEVELGGVFIRCSIHAQGNVTMTAVIRWRSKSAADKRDAVARYIVTEREMVVPIASSNDQERREWLIRTMDGYLWRFQAGLESSTYARLAVRYQDWAHPSLESIAARLTDAQKAAAIAMIRERFRL